ncbi:MAG: asparaginase [Clostridia bacterium]|nr:asparaginase [Clostridia bacterium]
MKEILLILVGGTICTKLNENKTLTVSDKAGLWLTENFYNKNPEYKELVHFNLSENLLILSENMTVEKWNLIIKTYQEEIKKKKFDGVIFAHGTDTLAYSAALFSMLLSGTDIPVFFVSSNARLERERANGNENFRCATECIYKGVEPNVYVAYKNISDKEMYIHLGSRIKQCENYSEDFYSKGAIKEKDMEKISFRERKALIDMSKEITLEECVLMLDPYTGMNYDVYDYSKFKAVLHGSFHSGTACTEKNTYSESYGKNSILYMIDKCNGLNVDTYLSPATLNGEIYETVDIIRKHTDKTKFLYGLTKETAYAKLLIAYSLFTDPKDREKFIETECNFEITE